MPAKDRPPAFLFYPRDYLSSRAVSAMHPTARGGYVHLLCHAWLGDRPGWLPDDDKLLSALSGLGERWNEHRDSIARAWRVRKGWWVQPIMVQSRRAQKRRRKRAVDGANETNRKRWGATNSVAQRPDSESHSVALPLPLPLQLQDSKSTPSLAALAESVEVPHVNGNGKPPDRGNGEAPVSEWMEAFPEFWRDYPRKVARTAAERAYAKIKPRTQETCDLIFAGLDHYRKTVWPERPPDKIEHASTWLNQRRFDDASETP